MTTDAARQLAERFAGAFHEFVTSDLVDDYRRQIEHFVAATRPLPPPVRRSPPLKHGRRPRRTRSSRDR